MRFAWDMIGMNARSPIFTRLKAMRFTSATTERTILLAPVVGVVAGVGAILFHLMCVFVTHYCLGVLAGYEQGGPDKEAGFADIFGRSGATSGHIVVWLLILVPVVGGLISGAVVYLLAPEAEGHGTDAAIDAYHNRRGQIRVRVPLVKMVASAITLGTGGSGGREGPIAQIGAGFGSFLATQFKLSDKERRILMAVGLGAGIGAIFHAPLAGAIFAIEVLYRDPDFEAEALIPAFIGTTVSFSVFSVLMFLITSHYAFDPLFVTPAGLTFDDPLLLAPLTVLAGAMAMASLGYVKCFNGVRSLFNRIAVAKIFRPALGALATGVLAVTAYLTLRAWYGGQVAEQSLSILSFGYGFLQTVLNSGDGQLLIPVLLVVGLGKMLSTSLTIGSGGSGGVFGPSMVIGGALGAVVGLVFHRWLLPGVVGQQDVVIFTILGMASFFAAAANTPVSTLIMVSELTGSYELLLPSMWCCALAYIVSQRWTIYNEQVKGRIDSPAHRGDFIVDVLEGMSVRGVLTDTHRNFLSVLPGMALREMDKLITNTKQICFPVVDVDSRYHGLFSLNDIRQLLYDSDLADLTVAEDLLTNIDPLTMDMDLSRAISRFAQSQFEELPVVGSEDPQQVVAMLRRQDVIAAYNSQMLQKSQS